MSALGITSLVLLILGAILGASVGHVKWGIFCALVAIFAIVIFWGDE